MKWKRYVSLQAIMLYHLSFIIIISIINYNVLLTYLPKSRKPIFFFSELLGVNNNIIAYALNGIASIVMNGIFAGEAVALIYYYIYGFLKKDLKPKMYDIYLTTYYYSLIFSCVVLCLFYGLTIINKDLIFPYMYFTNQDWTIYLLYGLSSFIITLIIIKREIRCDSVFLIGIYFASMFSIFLYPLTFIKYINTIIRIFFILITYLIGLLIIGIIIYQILQMAGLLYLIRE